MNICDPKIEAYLQDLLPVRHAELRAMEAIAQERNFPAVGPLVGQTLAVLASMIRARRMLELGSGFGYSAAWLVSGAGAEGHLIGTERSEKNIAEARDHLKAMGLDARVTFVQIEAVEFLRHTEGPFDLIFNDVDKADYATVFREAFPKLRVGGLLVSDNALWGGEVAGTAADPETAAIREHNRLMFTTPGAASFIVPVRDGVGVTMRLK